ncbi:MAG: molybdopterin oxidoreductase family protein [Alphaproteobacteria bacterium]
MSRVPIDLSPPVSDTVKTTTCYMCACRCGIRVHLKDGQVRYIEGNRAHPVNKGVLCAKGSAGIMQHYSPARLSKPLKRVGERGSGRFEAIEWDEALALATGWLGAIRERDPKQLAFFTGRDQSQALTGWWASQFGTPNYAAHGGFCSVNMAAGGIYTIGGSFWEFGEPDWEHAEYFMMFGVAEDHDSNPIKAGLAKLKARGAKIVAVNPVRTGYGAIADEWLGVTPGGDGLLILSLCHELLRAGRVDLEWMLDYSNAGWLVLDEDGLFARDGDGKPLCWDRATNSARPAAGSEVQPAPKGRFTLPDGRTARPSFEIMAERYADARYAPDAVAERAGVSAATIRRIAAELAAAAFDSDLAIEQPWTDTHGRKHERMVGRPVSIHAMRGISAHVNGFHTCRALHLLQMLLGAVDRPGSYRYKPPFPRPAPPGPKPAGRPDQIAPGQPMPGPPLGFTAGPEDLILADDGAPQRIDHAFSWEAPVSAHGMMHTVIGNAVRGDPYRIDTLFMYMANMAWNSAMNSAETIDMLTAKDDDGGYKIPHIIYSDAYFSEMVAYADLILPDTTYLERWDCISLLDRPISDADGVADAIRQPIATPDRDVRPFQDVLIEIGARLGLPGLVDDEGQARYPNGYADYLVGHERKPGVGSLAGWRGHDGSKQGVGAPNPKQLEAYTENDCHWRLELAPNQRYYRYANQAYLDWSAALGFIDHAERITLQLYSEPMQRFRRAAEGHGEIQPPEHLRQRVKDYFDPLPIWYAPFEDAGAGDDFPLHAVTQRPMAMYHAWGSQNAWLRQIHAANRLYMSRKLAAKLDIADDDWVWVESRKGQVKAQARLMDGVNDHTVWTWNAIGKRAGAWNLGEGAPESTKGFLLNHLIDDLQSGTSYANADPVTGQAAWYDLRVRVRKAGVTEQGTSAPQFATLQRPPGMAPAPDTLQYGKPKTGAVT